MKNIIIYIILDINRKYIGFGCCSVSILFEEESIIKRGRCFDETIWINDECNKFVVFILSFIYKLIYIL